MKSSITRRDFVGLVVGCIGQISVLGADRDSKSGWQTLPLIVDGKVSPDWVHLGYGGFSVDSDALRTDCDPKGLGLLVYEKQPLGNCQVKIIFKTKDAKSNSGVYVRIADGILDRVKNPGPAFDRNAAGSPSAESMERVKAAAEREEGAWFAVHRGYEVQIDGSGDLWHRTGAIYSLAPVKSAEKKSAAGWQTMIITLKGEQVNVELDGQPVSSFDSGSSNIPPRKQWYEPKREPKRPAVGYLGLQNHDPGDVVWFKEVSVRPLTSH